MVGEGVIRKQQKDLREVKVTEKAAKEYKLTRPYFERTEYLKNGGFVSRLPNAKWVLVDVDGTVATFTDPKTGASLRGPFEEHKVLVDLPIEPVIEMVRALFPSRNVCFVSGRHDFCGDDTCDWLEMHAVPFDHILMRYSGDNRSDKVQSQMNLKADSQSVKAPAPKVFFYGCLRDIDEQHTEAGHYMREPGYRLADREVTTPWGTDPDGTLCPDGAQHQGVAKLHQKDGWTAIGFWDRTGDARMKSNSNFVVRGTYTFDEMCKLAQETYPELWRRIGTVREYGK